MAAGMWFFETHSLWHFLSTGTPTTAAHLDILVIKAYPVEGTLAHESALLRRGKYEYENDCCDRIVRRRISSLRDNTDIR
jgi:hypothetical protein